MKAVGRRDVVMRTGAEAIDAVGEAQVVVQLERGEGEVRAVQVGEQR